MPVKFAVMTSILASAIRAAVAEERDAGFAAEGPRITSTSGRVYYGKVGDPSQAGEVLGL